MVDRTKRRITDRESALAAVKHDGRFYIALDKTFRDDPEIALEAVIQDSSVYGYLPELLQKDLEIAETAVRGNPELYYELPEGPRENQRIARIAIQGDLSNNPCQSIFSCFPEKLQMDEEIGMFLVRKYNPRWPTPLPNKLLEDPAFAAKAVKANDHIYQALLPELRNNWDVALALLNHSNENFWLLPPELQNDRDFMLFAVQHDGRLYQRLNNLELLKDREIILAAVTNDARMYSYIPYEFTLDQEIASAADENIEVRLLVATDNWGEFRMFKSQYLRDHPECDPDLLEVGLSDNDDILAMYDGTGIAVFGENGEFLTREDLDILAQEIDALSRDEQDIGQ